jgi:hypothetical protein
MEQIKDFVQCPLYSALSLCSMPCIKKPSKCTYELCTLFIDHTYMFRLSSYSVTYRPTKRIFYDLQIQPFNHFILVMSRILEFYNIS